METSAKLNEGVEEAFFTLARFVIFVLSAVDTSHVVHYSDCKARLIDSQADAAGAPGGATNADGSVKVNQPTPSPAQMCCT